LLSLSLQLLIEFPNESVRFTAISFLSKLNLKYFDRSIRGLIGLLIAMRLGFFCIPSRFIASQIVDRKSLRHPHGDADENDHILPHPIAKNRSSFSAIIYS
jgi:hypothetical protein